MQSFNVKRTSKIIKTGRLLQMSAIYDVPDLTESAVEWQCNLPIDEFNWNIGLIAGVSGSGKTTVAKELFGDRIVENFQWDREKSIIDCFSSELSIKDITNLLTSVGFGSPPNWVRPYHVLSNGEKFRATVARGLAEYQDLLVIDEFTSVVDRQIAQIASHTIQKAVRRRKQQFVAISCHYDIIEWLQPDWIYQPESDDFQRGNLWQRPKIDLQIYSVDKTYWKYFKKYHYMNTNLHNAAQCFGAFISDRCVAFISYLHLIHPKVKDIKQAHRLVVHPDYQGLSIGGILSNFLGQYLADRGFRFHYTIAHPAMINYFAKSPRWKLINSGRKSKGSKSSAKRVLAKQRNTAQRNTYSFAYLPLTKASPLKAEGRRQRAEGGKPTSTLFLEDGANAPSPAVAGSEAVASVAPLFRAEGVEDKGLVRM